MILFWSLLLCYAIFNERLFVFFSAIFLVLHIALRAKSKASSLNELKKILDTMPHESTIQKEASINNESEETVSDEKANETYREIISELIQGNIQNASDLINNEFDLNYVSSETEIALLPLLLGQGEGELMTKLSQNISENSKYSLEERQEYKLLVNKQMNIDKSAQFLIAKGADIESKDLNGCPPLMVASMNGSLNTMYALINAGAEIDYQKNNGRTALMEAVIQRGTKAVEILINSGASQNLQDKEGKTAKDFINDNDNDIKALLL